MTRWRIEELSENVRDALASASAPQNGQISAIPSKRTIRYYTTLGLLDAPAEMRGRTAFYDERHLLQLVAIKQLQLKGCSLAEVQTELAGADDAMLRKISGTEVTSPAPRTESPRRREAFWAAAPAPEPSGVEPPAEVPAPAAAEFAHLTVVQLAGGMTLHVPGVLNEEAVAKIVRAAEPFTRSVTDIAQEALSAPHSASPLSAATRPDDGERVLNPTPESSTTKGDPE